MPQVYEASKFYFTALMEDEVTIVQTKYLKIVQPELVAPTKLLPLEEDKNQGSNAQQEWVIHITNDFKGSHFLLCDGYGC